MIYDCIIIGAGPSGLMAAAQLDKNLKVLIIEKKSSAGNKLLLTGGGRCNVTNLKANKEFLDEVDYNKKFLYSAISKFGPKDIYNFFQSNGVALKEEVDNRIFPKSNKAQDILKCLLKTTKHIQIKYEESLVNIMKEDYIIIKTTKEKYRTKNLIIATGGASFEHTGSSGEHIKFAKTIEQPVIDLFPAEVGIVLNNYLDLAGISHENVNVVFDNKKTSGTLMFTHDGLSGESIMKMSEHIFKSKNKNIKIDFIPNDTIEEIKGKINNFDREKELLSFFNTMFQKRFSSYLIQKLAYNKKVKQLVKQEIDEIVKMLKECEFTVKCTKPLNTAYITGGGIDMNYINSTTMESTINSNIYFIGEALDIHGPVGGYNITLALSTGALAASAINKKTRPLDFLNQ